MKKKIIKLFEKRIEALYQESRECLLLESSYTSSKINFKNVFLFLNFLESVLEKPYNRLRALSVFLNHFEDFRTDLMYPFALLKSEIKEAINDKETESVRLATTLDECEFNENYVILWQERQLTKETNDQNY